MDSFTNQDCSHYSTAPFDWLVDTNVLRTGVNSNVAGLFVKNNAPIASLIDQESKLTGIDEKIGKCAVVDAAALSKVKEFSQGLEKVYETPNKANGKAPVFMDSTRLTKPAEGISEVDFKRFQYLPHDPQKPLNNGLYENIGMWSRNNFRDNYSCN